MNQKELDSGAKVDGGDSFYIASGGSGSIEYPEGDVTLYKVISVHSVKYSDLLVHPCGHVAKIKDGSEVLTKENHHGIV